MVEYHSGLESLFADKRFVSKSQETKQGDGDVIISHYRHKCITQLSFFPKQLPAVKKQLAAYGISDVPAFSTLKTGKQTSAARVEADKIWLISDSKLPLANAKLYPLDLSSARNVIRLAGPRAHDVMARLCAVDFRDKNRNFYATGIHHVGVHIHHHSDGFDIYMPRSFAASLSELILEIASQYHVQMA